MSRRSRSRKGRKKRSSPVSGEQVRVWTPKVISVLLVAAAAGGVVAATGALERRTVELRQGAAVEVSFRWPATAEGGTWMPEAQRMELVELAQRELAAQGDPLGLEPLRHLSEVLERSGWFDGTPTVRRTGPNAVEVEGSWRRPTAWIRHDGIDFLVDAGGRLMPLAYPADQAQPHRRPVLNPGTRPPRRADGRLDYSRPWTSESVRASISLLELLREQPYWDQVAAVDAGGLGREQRLVVVTDRDSRIIWGGGPGQFHPGERSTTEKLRHLANFHSRREYTRHIDAGTAGYDLRAGFILFDHTASADGGA